MKHDFSAQSAKEICKSISKGKTALRACGANDLTSLARTFGILEAVADPLLATGVCKKIAELLKKPDAVAELLKVGKLEAGIPISPTSDASGMREVIIGVSNHPSIVVVFSNWGLRQTIRRDKVEFLGASSPTKFNNVVRRAHQMGVGDYPPYLAIALGAGETTVPRMVNAFSTFANQGRALNPTPDRLYPGPQRQGHLARRHAALRRLQRAGLERPADAAAAARGPARWSIR